MPELKEYYNPQFKDVLSKMFPSGRWSPLEIGVLLHYYAICEPHPKAGLDIIDGTIAVFVKDGIFRADDGPSGYRTTEKGNAWVELILSTPYPVNKWIDPRNND